MRRRANPAPTRIIALVGLMGVGKSSVGRRLANRLKLPFADGDVEIEAAAGMTVSEIFAALGEDEFRAGEARVMRRLLEGPPIVLATGGGAVLREANRRHLHERGTVVYLYTPVSLQLERTARDRNRPLLRTADPARVLSDLMAIRDPLYREIADVVIETDERPPRMVVLEIIERLEALAPR